MSYNKQYNTRHSGRYNTPGQFVSAGEISAQQIQTVGQHQYTPTPKPPPPPPPPQNQPIYNKMNTSLQSLDTEMKSEPAEGEAKPHWMKNKLTGVKKVSNKERRRRQNANLRRLLSPKNALMVLSEMMPNNHIPGEFTVEAAANPQSYYGGQQQHSFCADLTIDGNNYKGYGENKLSARNAAAEQAIRDLIIKKISKLAQSQNNGDSSSVSEMDTEEEPLPMIQLASFALHKLFSEWEYEGHKVPQLKPPAATAADDNISTGSMAAAPRKAAPKPRVLPTNAACMHPCMLLSFMRPGADWRDLQQEGTTPQNTVFTMGVHIDGNTYLGKGQNKKEARKNAAKSACETLFQVMFEPVPSATTPLLPQ